MTRSIAVIGYGAMAASLHNSLKRHEGLRLETALVPAGDRSGVPEDLHCVTSVADLIATRPDLIVECATHEAVRDSVPVILRAGIDMVIVSVGALAAPEMRAAIEEACRVGKSRAAIVSGAIGGLDVLRAAALAGLDHVTYVGRKPPAAWRGTPAETLLDLETLDAPAFFYEGTAVEAARDYPKNANVTAAVALAGLGFQATRVKLVADPRAETNTHELEAQGRFGRFRIVLENHALPQNPKTSWLAALSVEQAVLRHFNSLEV